MSTSDLSTPQKILRDTLKARLLPRPPSPPRFVPPSVPPIDNDPGEKEEEEERRRIERIRLGRESLDRRKRRLANSSASLSRSSSLRADDDGDVDMDRNGAVQTPPSSIGGGIAAGKRNQGARLGATKRDDADAPHTPDAKEGEGEDGREQQQDEGEEEEEEEPVDRHAPRRSSRKVTKSHILRENEEERARRKRDKEKEAIRSRFIEGSMRDRASAPPPREIIGSESDSDDDGDDGDEGDYQEHVPPNAAPGSGGKEGEREKKKRSFTFRLGGLFRFNPFTLVDEARAAYMRQRALYEVRERKKEEMKRHKMEAEQLYMEMKARGEFIGTFVTHQDDIGRAVSTDDDQAVDFSHDGALIGSPRKRKHGEVTSVRSEMDGQVECSSQENEHSDREGSGDLYDAMVDGTEPAYPERQEPDYPERQQPEEIPTVMRYEASSGSASATESKSPNKKGIRHMVKTSSKIFSLTPNSSSTSLSASNGAPSTSLTKRELKKQERLQKKVSNLEEQLEKVRRELEETRRYGSIPPVPDIPKHIMQPPAPPHPTPVSREQMPPPPMPRSMKGTLVSNYSKQILPDTPGPRHPNQMLPDTPGQPELAGDRYAPGAMSPSGDTTPEDTTMDEGFSMIPLSPVLNSSTIIDNSTQQPEALRVRRNNGRGTSPGLPGLSGLRKISGASVRKVSNAISSVVSGGDKSEERPAEKPEKKKRRGLLESPPLPPKKWAANEEVPPIPKLPANGAGK